MSIMERHSAMPEWLTREDLVNSSWTVEAGSPARGGAWTTIIERRMSVPEGNDQLSRLIRAHEMVHAKVSPQRIFMDDRYGVTHDSLIAAEELRVNTLVGVAGFPVNDLADGSEGTAGEVYGQNKDWNQAVRALAAFLGTKGAAAFIRGVRKHDAAMAESLGELSKLLKRTVKRMSKEVKFSSTDPVRTWTKEDEDEVTHPQGWGYTIELAKILDSHLINEKSDEIPSKKEMVANLKGERGKFAKLVELKVPKPDKVDGRLGRKRVAADSGRNPRRINRMLTDPDHKVFDRRIKGRGGVILIDQSGSMDLSQEDVWEMIKLAPGCVIIGYSHRPGTLTEPNVWVLADRGSVCKEIPRGGGGNGVDGPAIRFAAKHVRNGEPFVWVCDGIVTDGVGDDSYTNLTVECLKLARQHNIHMVEDVPQALRSLKNAAKGVRLSPTLVGPLSRLDDRGW